MLSEINNDMRPGIVHRLDKDTSGLLVVAKTDVVHAALAKQFAARTVDREYRAIVWGKFRRRAGSIEADLGRSRSDRKKIAVVEGGRHALTTYQVLEQFSYLALVSLRLLTGRTHQIRVHLSHIHHPVLGDPTYGGRRIVYGPHTPKQKTEVQHLLELMPRQALHARTLGFIHPATKEKLMFASDPPDDMAMVLTMLRAKR
jgi:23S rRNA pseudouridine1911/1915/1917 synthase